MTIIAYGPADPANHGLTSEVEMAGIEIDETGITVTVELADQDDDLRLRFDRESCNPAVFALLIDARREAAA